jgi:hypothetical protein
VKESQAKLYVNLAMCYLIKKKGFRKDNLKMVFAPLEKIMELYCGRTGSVQHHQALQKAPL